MFKMQTIINNLVFLYGNLLEFYPFNTGISIWNNDISIYEQRYLYFNVNAYISIWNTDISN